jgi:hypothetical protein
MRISKLFLSTFFLFTLVNNSFTQNLIGTVLNFSPLSVSPGESINLTGTISNSGYTGTGGGIKVNFFLSSSTSGPDYGLILRSVNSLPALGAGQSENFNETGTVPASTVPGLYYVWLSIDPDNTISETNESDNQIYTSSRVNIGSTTSSDLCTIYGYIVDGNFGCAGFINTSVYLFQDGIKKYTSIGTMPGQEHVQGSFYFVDVVPGNYIMQVSEQGTLYTYMGETPPRVSLNVLNSSTIVFDNLTMSNYGLRLCLYYLYDQISGHVYDAGNNQPLNGVNISRLTDSKPDVKSFSDGSFYLFNNSAGFINFEFSKTGYQNQTIQVSKQFGVAINDLNVYLQPTNVGVNQPNLHGTLLNFDPVSVTPGGSIILSGTISNNGTIGTGGGIKVNFFLSSNISGPDYGLILRSVNSLPALGAGQSENFNETGIIPSTTTPGLYYVWLSIDPDNTINESNENDNQMHSSSQVDINSTPLTNPVLFVSMSTWTAPPGGGSSTLVSVTNTGTGGAISYSIYSNATWLTTSALSGSTSGSFKMTATANNSGSPRTANVTITATLPSGVSGSPKVIRITQETRSANTNEVSLSTNSVTIGTTITTTWSGWSGGVHVAIYKGGQYWASANSMADANGSQDLGTSGWEIRDDYQVKVFLRSDESIYQFSDYFSVTPDLADAYLVFFDDFNRISIGSDWQIEYAGGSASIYNEELRLINPANSNESQTKALIVKNGTQLNNAMILFNLNNGPENSQLNNTFIYLRYKNSDNYYYVKIWEENNYSPNRKKVFLKKIVNGQRYDLAVADNILLAPGQYQFSVIDNQITFKKISAGTYIYLSAMDNDIIGAGQAGFGVNEETTTFDNVRLYNVGFSNNVGENNRNVTPSGYELAQNYPNPFNPETIIHYGLPKNEHVLLRVMNLQGQLIISLVDEFMAAGTYNTIWNGRDQNGNRVGNGMYLYELQAGVTKLVRRMVLLK